ncbi:MAG: glutamate formiminotransferase / 5-formyltetrahydrofolate cyclo-ligase [Solirubrobacteraceae bacterium]|nr:glutamate formiminotransferase / 5-formyltetrahydrofolate cyclo-ligase [Solirubrobacteraceae bacterium]
MTTLLAYPNVSEGRDRQTIAAVARAFGPHLIDQHTDPDHHRTAFTLAGAPGDLAGAVLPGAAEAIERIAIDRHQGVHPRVGAIDVAPIIYTREADRGAAAAEALVLADRLGAELELPVLLYGILAGGRTRADLRRGGPGELARRLHSGELKSDFGPSYLHPSAGAVLVAARPPLLAFNVELAPPATLDDARTIAAAIREHGREGLPGVRAIGVWLASRNRAQVSTNIEDPARTSPAAVLAAIERHTQPEAAELVGLAPEATLADFPDHLPLHGRDTIEAALARHAVPD